MKLLFEELNIVVLSNKKAQKKSELFYLNNVGLQLSANPEAMPTPSL